MTNFDNGYKTKQKTAVLSVFLMHPEEHYTADSLLEVLHRDGVSIGTTTVYRTLEKLADAGVIRKFTATASDSACYQYAGDDPLETDCHSHFHLKCLSCGRLYHVDCDHLAALSSHLGEKHGFSVDYSKTVLYGTCSACQKAAKQKVPCTPSFAQDAKHEKKESSEETADSGSCSCGHKHDS